MSDDERIAATIALNLIEMKAEGAFYNRNGNSKTLRFSSGSGKGGLNSNNPQSYLDRALKNPGLDGTPAKMKEVWTEGDYKYTVRVHEGNSLHTDAE